MNHLQRQLNEVKDAPELGALEMDRYARMREKVMARVQTEVVQEKVQSGIMDAVKAPFHGLSAMETFRPAFAFASMLLFVTGWMGSVLASTNSLPGDVLYSLKRVTERAQLTLAKTDAEKARLHLEFANRRADELSQILTVIGKDAPLVRQTMGSMRAEVTQATEKLETLRRTDERGAGEVARLMERKVPAVDTVAEQAGATQEGVQDVREAVQVATVAASEVLREVRLKEVRGALKEAEEKLAAVQVRFTERQALLREKVGPIGVLQGQDKAAADALRVGQEKLDAAVAHVQEAAAALEAEDAKGAEGALVDAMRLLKEVEEGLPAVQE